jgi:Phosphopantothenate-cysteine ligase (EC 6.3.2.5)/Phosphopantothenoylcysteine decarboxylase (EC 4.1.1.36)
LASRYTQMKAEVRTIMTANACKLISPLTFKSITHQKVATEMFDQSADIEHISLADWADLIVIAPATANIIGKVAVGIADDLLSTTIMASKAPVCFVPAMNVNMYQNPIVQSNMKKLQDYGYHFMEPESGMLACGYEGKGRFPAVEEIVYFSATKLNYGNDLKNISVLLTAGANQEAIDPMRYLSNQSSGKMGLAIARAAYYRGADVTLIHGAISEQIPYYLKTISTISAAEMHQAVIAEFSKNEIIIKAAAVADWTPSHPQNQKIKKNENLELELTRTKDILAELGTLKKQHQFLVGFAAESEDISSNARFKLQKKNLDLVVANDIKIAGKDQTEVIVMDRDQEYQICGTKFEVAHKILDEIIKKRSTNE